MRSRGRSEIGGEIDAIVRRVARSTIAIIEGCDRRACSSDVRAARQSTSALAIAIDKGRDCPTSRRSSALSSSSLSLRSGLSFLSLSLSGNDLN